MSYTHPTTTHHTLYSTLTTKLLIAYSNNAISYQRQRGIAPPAGGGR